MYEFSGTTRSWIDRIDKRRQKEIIAKGGDVEEGMEDTVHVGIRFDIVETDKTRVIRVLVQIVVRGEGCV